MAIALITGTSSGIGLATAITLARACHTVIATTRNVDAAGELLAVVAAEQLPVTTLCDHGTIVVHIKTECRATPSKRLPHNTAA